MNNFKAIILSGIMLAGTWLTGRAGEGDPEFGATFRDSTLRVDYTLGRILPAAGEELQGVVLINQLASSPGWAGRRHSLRSHPLKGDGRIVMTDAESGDTLYVNTFSTLFQEWAADAAPDAMPEAFENTQLMPMPKRKARVNITLADKRQRPIAQLTHTVDPSDILIRHIGEMNPGRKTRVIHEGESENPIDVVILAEGYREDEMDLFFPDAERSVGEILRYKPFRGLAGSFRFVAAATASDCSGVSVPKNGEWRQTPFGSHFSTFHADRYLTTPRIHAIHDAAAGLPYEHIIILANTDEYGGGGIYNSCMLIAAHSDRFLPALVHEFGHSFGGLADEYFSDKGGICTYPLDVEPWEANITTLVDFGSKWKDMTEGGEAGLYEGGAYTSKGVWRGSDECRMRNNTYPDFCPVCRRALKRVIEFYTGARETE